MSRFNRLRIAEIRPETRDTVSIRFDVPADLCETYRYRQGQHLTLRARIDGEEVMRTYSICTGVQDQELRVAVKRQPHGRFSTHAHERLRAGQTLEVMPPAGHFNTPLDPSQTKHYLAFAAGSGITPVISIIRTTLAVEPKSRFTLVYGNRDTASMIFREQLEDLANAHVGRLDLIPVLSRERTGPERLHGRIDAERCQALFRGRIDPSQMNECFICGPEPMIHAVRESLQSRHVDPAHIHFELFTTPDEAGTRHRQRIGAEEVDHSISEVVVLVDGGRLEFPLPRNTESVLDAGLRAGADLPFSCKGGMCATCRARVLEGEVAMEVNYALEDEEVAAGYVLTCQSYPISRRLVVSYDE